MKLLQHLTPEELGPIKAQIAEAFIPNELFHAFGSVADRRDTVTAYMNIFVDYVYASGALYALEDGQGYLGFQYSGEERNWPAVKMLFRLLRVIPFRVVKPFVHHLNQVKDQNKEYASHPHASILFACVPQPHQGKGNGSRLVAFAKGMAEQRNLPLLIDTDMKDYAEKYQHLGCTLYRETTADNGVTRYNLVYLPKKHI